MNFAKRFMEGCFARSVRHIVPISCDVDRYEEADNGGLTDRRLKQMPRQNARAHPPNKHDASA